MTHLAMDCSVKELCDAVVGLVPTTHDGTWKVIFASRQIAQLDMRDGTVKTVTHVSEHL